MRGMAWAIGVVLSVGACAQTTTDGGGGTAGEADTVSAEPDTVSIEPDAVSADADAVSTGADTGAADTACVPDCGGRECGTDGCGGSCGACDDGLSCTEDVCHGGSCVYVAQGPQCAVDGACVSADAPDPADPCRSCQPLLSRASWSPLPEGAPCGGEAVCHQGACCDPTAACAGHACGDDGCGGTCGTCTAPAVCVGGQCCAPDCEGKACGEDGCGGTCGECGAPDVCVEGQCCTPECAGATCGADGCGGACGACDAPDVCVQGGCCTPACDGKTCGPDACGGSCGACALGSACQDGSCFDPCTAPCDGLDCGPDACGGQCGACGDGTVCGGEHLCVDAASCVPACGGKACGPDGCGGTCGTCDGDQACSAQGECTPGCVPHCWGPCGPDGCGGWCGGCKDDAVCTAGGECGNLCSSCGGGAECTTLSFEQGTLSGWGFGGAVQVIGSLGPLLPSDGNAMLSLSTGVGALEGRRSEATFPTCLPAGPHRVSFDLRVVSAELLSSCAGTFQDKLRVTVRSGKSKAVWSRLIRDLCPPDACSACGTSFVGLEPSQVFIPGPFDPDGAYQTPWFPAELFVQPSGPANATSIAFSVSDTSDGVFDTVLLVDNVRFEPCVADCAGKTCGPDGCGGTCGACAGAAPCVDGVCCVPDCEGKACGPDGCGGSCGACGDQNDCTHDACTEAGQCAFLPVAAGTPCAPDALACTVDACDGSGACQHAPSPDPLCCEGNADCDDTLPCTGDRCEAGQCVFEPIAGLVCCDSAAVCDDADDVCTPEDTCEAGLCVHTHAWIPGCCPGPTVFDFADGLQGFALDNVSPFVGWHWQKKGPHNATPPALYYGIPVVWNYNFKVSSGTVTSPAIALVPGAATLTFRIYLDVEPSLASDQLTVRARLPEASGNKSLVLWTRDALIGLDPGPTGWLDVTVSLAAVAGETIVLEWAFDTVDSTLNTGEGVWLDDIAVEQTCDPPSCAVSADCDDGLAGSEDTCSSGVCTFTILPEAPPGPPLP